MRACRDSGHITRFEVVKRMFFLVGTQSIVRYEKGLVVPSLDVALSIAAAIGVPVDRLTDA